MQANYPTWLVSSATAETLNANERLCCVSFILPVAVVMICGR